jgi:dTDP-glucose 4,6-dehydratase
MSGGKKILVTGGSGFIGTNLVNELRSRNHDVIACDLLNHELPVYPTCIILE